MATLNIKNLPESIARQLRKRARLAHRSVTGEVIHLIEQALTQDSRHSILELRGLGKEAWKGIDAGRHVAAERETWG